MFGAASRKFAVEGPPSHSAAAGTCEVFRELIAAIHGACASLVGELASPSAVRSLVPDADACGLISALLLAVLAWSWCLDGYALEGAASEKADEPLLEPTTDDDGGADGDDGDDFLARLGAGDEFLAWLRSPSFDEVLDAPATPTYFGDDTVASETETPTASPRGVAGITAQPQLLAETGEKMESENVPGLPCERTGTSYDDDDDFVDGASEGHPSVEGISEGSLDKVSEAGVASGDGVSGVRRDDEDAPRRRFLGAEKWRSSKGHDASSTAKSSARVPTGRDEKEGRDRGVRISEEGMILFGSAARLLDLDSSPNEQDRVPTKIESEENGNDAGKRFADETQSDFLKQVDETLDEFLDKVGELLRAPAAPRRDETDAALPKRPATAPPAAEGVVASGTKRTGIRKRLSAKLKGVARNGSLKRKSAPEGEYGRKFWVKALQTGAI